MALIIVIFGEFLLADGRTHDIVPFVWQGLFSSDSGVGTVAGCLFSTVDVIFAEVCILGVD